VCERERERERGWESKEREGKEKERERLREREREREEREQVQRRKDILAKDSTLTSFSPVEAAAQSQAHARIQTLWHACFGLRVWGLGFRV